MKIINKIKRLLKWPEDMCKAIPARLKKHTNKYSAGDEAMREWLDMKRNDL